MSPRIIYMGTPEFAVAPLKALVEGGYNVVAVVTMPDKPSGRGMQLQHSAVKQYALSVDIPILQPEKLKAPTFIEQLRALNADLQIVVAFRMLPEVVWDMPPMGTFNLHASLLPQYRGAAPINWAIINGERETGITTFLLQHEIDTGAILFQEKIAIEESDNVGTIYEKLMTLGATLVPKTVDALAQGNITPIPQREDHALLHPAPKIFKETCRIDWNKSAVDITNLVRGLSPYPAAWTRIALPNGKDIDAKILKCAATTAETFSKNTGQVTITKEGKLIVHTAGSAVEIEILQPAGKRKMNAQEWLNGISAPAELHFT